jgi:hypothetical protein
MCLFVTHADMQQEQQVEVRQCLQAQGAGSVEGASGAESSAATGTGMDWWTGMGQVHWVVLVLRACMCV